MRRLLALALWCYAAWVLLTWTLTLEQLVVGAVVALLAALALVDSGDVAPPWQLLSPRRLLASVRMLVECAARILVANAQLARRVWLPQPPLATGMVKVPTRMRSEGELAAVGLVSSLIVENQIVDTDRERSELLYHAVEVPDGGAQAAYDEINGPVERLVAAYRSSR